MSKRGLPNQSKMRHDAHFVDALSESFSGAIGKHLPVSAIETNPGQPRQNVGDLTELKASIESKGILEPILVRPIASGKYQIISGERRFRAAIEAGLTEVPCIEFDVEENEVLEIAMIENLHRKDLTPFEEAEGFNSLIERFEYTHQRVAETVGKSRVGITESLSLLRIPGGPSRGMSARRHCEERAPGDRPRLVAANDGGADSGPSIRRDSGHSAPEEGGIFVRRKEAAAPAIPVPLRTKEFPLSPEPGLQRRAGSRKRRLWRRSRRSSPN